MPRAPADGLAERYDVRPEVPTLGQKTTSGPAGVLPVPSEAAHDFITNHRQASSLRLGHVGPQQLRGPRRRRDTRTPLRLEQNDAELVLVRIKILDELRS